MAEEAKKSGEDKSQTSSHIQEQIMSFHVKVEAFRSKNQEANDLLTESEQLLHDVDVAFAKQVEEFSQKEEGFKAEAKSLQEQVETLKTREEEKDKKIKALEEENEKLREHEIAGLQQELEVNKTSREVLEKKLEAAEKAKKGGFGKGAATGSLIVLLFLLGAWLLLGKPSPGSDKIASSGSGKAAIKDEAEKHSTAPSLLTNSAVIKKYREYTESHASVRAYDPLLVGGRQQVVSICEEDRLGFVLKQIVFEGGEIQAVSLPIDTYGDGRQKWGFHPCTIPAT